MAIATAMAAARTVTRQRDGDAMATVMEAYRQDGAGRGLSPKQISAISTFVAKWSEAKVGMDYARTNEIFDLLSRGYGINIGDRAGEWALVHKEYAFNPNVLFFVPDKDLLVAIGKGGGEYPTVR